jgi:hypothetical protein
MERLGVNSKVTPATTSRVWSGNLGEPMKVGLAGPIAPSAGQQCSPPRRRRLKAR